MCDRRGTQGRAAFDRPGAVKLGEGRKYNKIEALIKLIIFLAGLHILIKSFVCRVEQPIAMRLPSAGGS